MDVLNGKDFFFSFFFHLLFLQLQEKSYIEEPKWHLYVGELFLYIG
jgi:hypothetical protein